MQVTQRVNVSAQDDRQTICRGGPQTADATKGAQRFRAAVPCREADCVPPWALKPMLQRNGRVPYLVTLSCCCTNTLRLQAAPAV